MPTDTEVALHPAIVALKDAASALLSAKATALDLTDERIASIEPLRAVEPAPVPALDQICGPLPKTTPDTERACTALQHAAPHMHWQRTYTQADGFPPDFLRRYGWFDLAGPDGPYSADNLRIMIGYWGAGLHYPDHSHVQEEHYLVLAGSAWFRLDDDPYRRVGPGQIFHTPPGAVHAAEMRDEPLIAMALWRAEDLSVRIHLTEADRQVDAG